MEETLSTTIARQEAIDRFWETVPAVWHRVRGQIRDTVADHFDITVEQFHILRHIRKGDGSISEMAAEKHISRSAISQAVDTLVEKGLISRCQKAHDRRYVQLELTEAGNALLNAIFAKNREWMAEQMAGLTAEQLNLIGAGLLLMKQALIETETGDLKEKN